MTTMTTYSYSRLNLYETCPRRFYLKYVAGMEESPTEPAELGKAIHRYIELALKGEADPMPIVLSEAAVSLKEKEILKLATHYLKKHQTTPNQRSEGHLVQLIGSRGAMFQGYIDLMDESGLIPLLTDFKSNRESYEPNDTFQLRMYAWLVAKTYGYEEVNARLWFVREPYKTCERLATYTQEDFEAAEQWATTLIDEIESGLTSIDLALVEPLEVFPTKHGHACTHCPFALSCRPDLLALDEQNMEDFTAKVLVLERVLELAKQNLKSHVAEHGTIRVGDEEFGLRPYESWSFPLEQTIETLRELGEDPIAYTSMDTTRIKSLWKKKPEATVLQEVGQVRTSHSFVHWKAGEES